MFPSQRIPSLLLTMDVVSGAFIVRVGLDLVVPIIIIN